ncbi:unnamed protein product [Polarella glacialis]|uniref:MsrB domain-containing protein n=1 Tax=Polarella glacialis TaxID=89957 RepID=A0A813KAL6_POLGL|nr:unnamed protein product [Polarella glacialis]CAE8701873.1 unnamed protein product [Polarella glacialis]
MLRATITRLSQNFHRPLHFGTLSAAMAANRDPSTYEEPTQKGSTHLLPTGAVDVKLPDAEWKSKLPENVYKVLRQKATEPGHKLTFPKGFDDHKAEGVYACAGCLAAGFEVPLYTSRMKFDCGCGWPGFWTNVKDAVYEKRDADGRRCEVLCSRCDGHMGHVFRGEAFGHPTDERHCVNSLSLVFLPAKGGDKVAPTYSGAVYG